MSLQADSSVKVTKDPLLTPEHPTSELHSSSKQLWTLGEAGEYQGFLSTWLCSWFLPKTHLLTSAAHANSSARFQFMWSCHLKGLFVCFIGCTRTAGNLTLTVVNAVPFTKKHWNAWWHRKQTTLYEDKANTWIWTWCTPCSDTSVQETSEVRVDLPVYWRNWVECQTKT